MAKAKNPMSVKSKDPIPEAAVAAKQALGVEAKNPTTNEPGNSRRSITEFIRQPLVAGILIVVLLAAAWCGWWAYNKYKPSKVNDPATRAQIEKASKDLKSINLASVKSSVDTVKSIANTAAQQSGNSGSGQKK